MAETVGTESGVSGNVENKKLKKTSVAKKPKSKPNHPPTAQMVNDAIKTLKERNGSSLPAIKKYLAANYKVDSEKLAPFIKKYLKSAVVSGKLIQTKGKGASGSFKLPSLAKTKAKGEGKSGAKKSAAKKPKEKSSKVEKKSVEKKKVEKKKTGVSGAKNAKSSGSPKVKASKPKTKVKKEKTAKTGSKTAKVPKPKKLSASGKSPKKVATSKASKK